MDARPNPNGNTHRHFVDAHFKLAAAGQAIRDARAVMLTNVVHGRNYQHFPDPLTASDEDRRLLDERINRALKAIGRIEADLRDVILENQKT